MAPVTSHATDGTVGIYNHLTHKISDRNYGDLRAPALGLLTMIPMSAI